MENRADYFKALAEGSINVDATVANTVQALDFGADAVGCYVTVVCATTAGVTFPFYITHGPTSTITNPDPAALTGAGQTWCETTGVYNRLISQETRYAEIYPTAAGFVRWGITSQKGG